MNYPVKSFITLGTEQNNLKCKFLDSLIFVSKARSLPIKRE
jgi:hypothetical protein